MRVLLTTSIFITCLLFGYQAGVSLGSSGQITSVPPVLASSAGNGPATPAVTLPNGQRSILLIGVDDLRSASPRLESIWIMSYVTNNTRLTFLPIYPSLFGPASEAGHILSERFRLTRNAGQTQLDPAFLEELHQQVPWWGSYLVVDRTAMVEMANAGMNPDVPESAPGLSELPHAWEDPSGALLAQADLFQELCWNATRSEVGVDFAIVVDQLPGHILSDLEPDALVEELDDVSVQMNRYSCEFPTLAVPGTVIGD